MPGQLCQQYSFSLRHHSCIDRPPHPDPWLFPSDPTRQRPQTQTITIRSNHALAPLPPSSHLPRPHPRRKRRALTQLPSASPPAHLHTAAPPHQQPGSSTPSPFSRPIDAPSRAGDTSSTSRGTSGPACRPSPPAPRRANAAWSGDVDPGRPARRTQYRDRRNGWVCVPCSACYEPARLLPGRWGDRASGRRTLRAAGRGRP